MNLGQAIKLCRIKRKISQAVLAERAECSVSYLSLLENNQRDPTLSTLRNISSALNMPLEILFFLASERDEIKGMDKTLSAELARTALELLSEPIQQ